MCCNSSVLSPEPFLVAEFSDKFMHISVACFWVSGVCFLGEGGCSKLDSSRIPQEHLWILKSIGFCSLQSFLHVDNSGMKVADSRGEGLLFLKACSQSPNSSLVPWQAAFCATQRQQN